MRRVALVVMLASFTASCATNAPPSSVPAAAAQTGWSEVPRAPLPGRYGVVAFWTGAEVLLIGGTRAAPCPPNADCLPPAEPPSTEGAAFNPATGDWRRIADAPKPVQWASGAVAGGSLYLVTTDAFLRYDVAADRWEEVPPPRGELWSLKLTAMGDDLLAYRSTQEFGVEPDAILDTDTRLWTEVPRDPLTGAYDRHAVWTGREIVLLGVPLQGRAPADPPLVAAAILDPGSLTWRRLPESVAVGGASHWGYAGGRVVAAAIGRSDGGEVNNWGRFFPSGGMLGPAGIWAELPDTPPEGGGFPGVSTAGGDYALADGWAFHVPTGSWTEIESPGVTPIDAATVWTGDRLFVWGGVEWNANEATILDRGFIWRP